MGAFSGLEIACWDILGKARGRPVHALWGGRLRERLRSYTYLYPGPDEDPASFYNDPDASAACAARMVEAGFTAVKFDPAGAYTIHGGHQPTLPDLDRSEAFCRRDPRGGRRPGRPPLRHARPVHAVRRDPAGAADRALRPALVRGAGAAGPAARPRAGGGAVAGADRRRRAADHQGRVRDAAARRRRRRSCSRASAGSAGCSRRARSRRWPRGSARRWRRTSTPGRSPGRRRSSSRCSIPNFLILETIGTGGGFHAELLTRADPLGGRLRAAAGRRRASGSRSTRRWRAPIPGPATGCTWR